MSHTTDGEIKDHSCESSVQQAGQVGVRTDDIGGGDPSVIHDLDDLVHLVVSSILHT